MTDFKDLGLSATTLKAVADTGYTTATPIQEQAIPVALAGRDVLGIAQTGTGKTAAFTLPLIDRLGSGRARARMPRALVLAPTRELADQVAASFEKYAKGTRLQWALLIGGVSMGDQLAALDKGVDVLIATPGRLIDLFERSKVLLTGVQIMVIDEADRMLDMGFIPDIERIFKMTPPKRQTLFFSATMPPEITRLTAQFLKDPTRIEVARPATTADTITQYLVRLPMSDPKAKRTALRALVGRDDVKNGIVFCNRKSEVDIVAKSLSVHGFDAAPIHGDLEQSMRTRTLDNFRKGDLKFLVASDVAARGLDIPDVSHVFNYDVPHHADDYVHRIGRTGRAGKSGQTFMIVTPADDKSLDKVLKLTGKAPNELTLDLDWAEIKVGADRDKARRSESDRKGGGRDRGGSRGGSSSGRDRDRSRGRPATETSTVGMEAIDQSDLPEATAAPAVRPERKERPARAEQTEATASAKPERARRSRKPRNENPAEDIAPAAVAEAAPVAVAEPEVREAPARRERDRDRERRPEPAREASRDRGERHDRSDRDRGGRRDRDDDGGPRVIGFGNDLPAFMTRVPPQIARNED